MALTPDWQGLGSLGLGLFVGYIAFFMIKNSTARSPLVLGQWLAVVLGGVVIDFIGDKLVGTSTTFGQYAAGLAIGLVLYIIVAILTGQTPVWLNRIRNT
jgi:hypothetical protein